jgi:TatD DNase family protein
MCQTGPDCDSLMFLDSHAHLEAAHFGEDLKRIVETAWEEGVVRILSIGNGIPGDDRVDATISIAEQYDFIYATVGVHPHDADGVTTSYLEELSRKAEHPKVVAWGEIGLDYHYSLSTRSNQRQALEQQLQYASDAGLPVIVHCRDAEDEIVAVLKAWKRDRPWGVLHCFTGSPWLAEQGIELGMYISFSGILTFKKAEVLRSIAKNVPINRLLVETDSPYLAPVPLRGRRNEPSYIRHTTEALAGLRTLDLDVLLRHLHMNFATLFSTPLPFSIS